MSKFADEIEARRLKFADMQNNRYEMPSDMEHRQIVAALRAMERLGSMEAFKHARMVHPAEHEELVARVTLAEHINNNQPCNSWNAIRINGPCLKCGFNSEDHI